MKKSDVWAEVRSSHAEEAILILREVIARANDSAEGSSSSGSRLEKDLAVIEQDKKVLISKKQRETVSGSSSTSADIDIDMTAASDNSATTTISAVDATNSLAHVRPASSSLALPSVIAESAAKLRDLYLRRDDLLKSLSNQYNSAHVYEDAKKGIVHDELTSKQPEPVRRRAHWDALLEEAHWMSTDFFEERRWKISAAKLLSNAAAAEARKRGLADWETDTQVILESAVTVGDSDNVDMLDNRTTDGAITTASTKVGSKRPRNLYESKSVSELEKAEAQDAVLRSRAALVPLAVQKVMASASHDVNPLEDLTFTSPSWNSSNLSVNVDSASLAHSERIFWSLLRRSMFAAMAMVPGKTLIPLPLQRASEFSYFRPSGDYVSPSTAAAAAAVAAAAAISASMSTGSNRTKEEISAAAAAAGAAAAAATEAARTASGVAPSSKQLLAVGGALEASTSLWIREGQRRRPRPLSSTHSKIADFSQKLSLRLQQKQTSSRILAAWISGAPSVLEGLSSTHGLGRRTTSAACLAASHARARAASDAAGDLSDLGCVPMSLVICVPGHITSWLRAIRVWCPNEVAVVLNTENSATANSLASVFSREGKKHVQGVIFLAAVNNLTVGILSNLASSFLRGRPLTCLVFDQRGLLKGSSSDSRAPTNASTLGKNQIISVQIAMERLLNLRSTALSCSSFFHPRTQRLLISAETIPVDDDAYLMNFMQWILPSAFPNSAFVKSWAVSAKKRHVFREREKQRSREDAGASAPANEASKDPFFSGDVTPGANFSIDTFSDAQMSDLICESVNKAVLLYYVNVARVEANSTQLAVGNSVASGVQSTAPASSSALQPNAPQSLVGPSLYGMPSLCDRFCLLPLSTPQLTSQAQVIKAFYAHAASVAMIPDPIKPGEEPPSPFSNETDVALANIVAAVAAQLRAPLKKLDMGNGIASKPSLSLSSTIPESEAKAEAKAEAKDKAAVTAAADNVSKSEPIQSTNTTKAQMTILASDASVTAAIHANSPLLVNLVASLHCVSQHSNLISSDSIIDRGFLFADDVEEQQRASSVFLESDLNTRLPVALQALQRSQATPSNQLRGERTHDGIVLLSPIAEDCNSRLSKASVFIRSLLARPSQTNARRAVSSSLFLIRAGESENSEWLLPHDSYLSCEENSTISMPIRLASILFEEKATFARVKTMEKSTKGSKGSNIGYNQVNLRPLLSADGKVAQMNSFVSIHKPLGRVESSCFASRALFGVTKSVRSNGSTPWRFLLVSKPRAFASNAANLLTPSIIPAEWISSPSAFRVSVNINGVQLQTPLAPLFTPPLLFDAHQMALRSNKLQFVSSILQECGAFGFRPLFLTHSPATADLVQQYLSISGASCVRLDESESSHGWSSEQIQKVNSSKKLQVCALACMAAPQWLSTLVDAGAFSSPQQSNSLNAAVVGSAPCTLNAAIGAYLGPELDAQAIDLVFILDLPIAVGSSSVKGLIGEAILQRLRGQRSISVTRAISQGGIEEVFYTTPIGKDNAIGSFTRGSGASAPVSLLCPTLVSRVTNVNSPSAISTKSNSSTSVPPPSSPGRSLCGNCSSNTASACIDVLHRLLQQRVDEATEIALETKQQGVPLSPQTRRNLSYVGSGLKKKLRDSILEKQDGSNLFLSYSVNEEEEEMGDDDETENSVDSAHLSKKKQFPTLVGVGGVDRVSGRFSAFGGTGYTGMIAQPPSSFSSVSTARARKPSNQRTFPATVSSVVDVLIRNQDEGGTHFSHVYGPPHPEVKAVLTPPVLGSDASYQMLIRQAAQATIFFHPHNALATSAQQGKLNIPRFSSTAPARDIPWRQPRSSLPAIMAAATASQLSSLAAGKVLSLAQPTIQQAQAQSLTAGNAAKAQAISQAAAAAAQAVSASVAITPAYQKTLAFPRLSTGAALSAALSPALSGTALSTPSVSSVGLQGSPSALASSSHLSQPDSNLERASLTVPPVVYDGSKPFLVQQSAITLLAPDDGLALNRSINQRREALFPRLLPSKKNRTILLSSKGTHTTHDNKMSLDGTSDVSMDAGSSTTSVPAIIIATSSSSSDKKIIDEDSALFCGALARNRLPKLASSARALSAQFKASEQDADSRGVLHKRRFSMVGLYTTSSERSAKRSKLLLGATGQELEAQSLLDVARNEMASVRPSSHGGQLNLTDWTPLEDIVLLRAVSLFGENWAIVSDSMQAQNAQNLIPPQMLFSAVASIRPPPAPPGLMQQLQQAQQQAQAASQAAQSAGTTPVQASQLQKQAQQATAHAEALTQQVKAMQVASTKATIQEIVAPASLGRSRPLRSARDCYTRFLRLTSKDVILEATIPSSATTLGGKVQSGTPPVKKQILRKFPLHTTVQRTHNKQRQSSTFLTVGKFTPSLVPPERALQMRTLPLPPLPSAVASLSAGASSSSSSSGSASAASAASNSNGSSSASSSTSQIMSAHKLLSSADALLDANIGARIRGLMRLANGEILVSGLARITSKLTQRLLSGEGGTDDPRVATDSLRPETFGVHPSHKSFIPEVDFSSPGLPLLSSTYNLDDKESARLKTLFPPSGILNTLQAPPASKARSVVYETLKDDKGMLTITGNPKFVYFSTDAASPSSSTLPASTAAGASGATLQSSSSAAMYAVSFKPASDPYRVRSPWTMSVKQMVKTNDEAIRSQQEALRNMRGLADQAQQDAAIRQMQIRDRLLPKQQPPAQVQLQPQMDPKYHQSVQGSGQTQHRVQHGDATPVATGVSAAMDTSEDPNSSFTQIVATKLFSIGQILGGMSLPDLANLLNRVLSADEKAAIVSIYAASGSGSTEEEDMRASELLSANSEISKLLTVGL